MTTGKWAKLSPLEFAQLQEYLTYTNKKVKDVLEEFKPGGLLCEYNPEEPINYEVFKKFMDIYLDMDAPDELCKHLFMSFVKTIPAITNPTHPVDTSANTIDYAPNQIILEKEDKPLLNVGQRKSIDSSPSQTHSASSIRNVNTDDIIEKVSAKINTLKILSHNKFGASRATIHSSHEPHSPTFLTSTSPDSNTTFRAKSLLASHSPLLSFTPKEKFIVRPPPLDITKCKIALKDVVCYLRLLEGGSPSEKLEFMFRLYDDDDNGILDKTEIDLIINQMMNVAQYLGWDVTELRPILRDMMLEIDYDSDGAVTLEEWIKGGITVIPLLVLLGLDQADATIKDDGEHVWSLKHFNRQSFCNLCLGVLGHFGRQGLTCTFCHYTVHERCVNKAPPSCIQTYVKTSKIDQTMDHHWVEGNCPFRCAKCHKSIKNGTTGLHCCWCQKSFHNKCVVNIRHQCDFGEMRDHLLPPICIRPEVLARSSKNYKLDAKKRKKSEDKPENETTIPANISFQINPLPNSHPLLVLINPKSGGKQGVRIMRKFQYLLNPRQVFNITSGGPIVGLNFFKGVYPSRILACGGDGTVGWILEVMDKVEFKCRPPVAILPLGTGNDLARCLRWGGGYEGEELMGILKLVEKASIVMMDRWSIMFSEVLLTPDSNNNNSNNKERGVGDPIPCNIFNNYFSIGVDASIARKFHLMREKHPEKFNSRMRNKLFYFELGTSETFSASCKDLHENIRLMVDGIDIDLTKGSPLEGIAILNIPSIYGGSNLWGAVSRNLGMMTNARSDTTNNNSSSSCKNTATSFLTNCLSSSKESGSLTSSTYNTSSSGAQYSNTTPQTNVNSNTNNSSSGRRAPLKPQDIGDQLIEIVGLESAIHAGQVKAGLRSSGRRIAQGSQIVIKTMRRFPMQIDGEPWLQPPCTITINLKNRVPMLMAPKRKRHKSLCGMGLIPQFF